MFLSLDKTLLAACSAAVALAVGSAGSQAQTAAYCDGYARDYASRYAHAGEDVIGGAIGGALTGAIIGSIVGGGKGAGRGAAIGGGVGAFGGAAHASGRWQTLYHHAFNECMSAGHASGPVATYSDGPEPWTPGWYEYCAAKYRSFNPQTGRYLAYSGEYRLCQ